MERKIIIGTEENGVAEGRPVIIIQNGKVSFAEEISHNHKCCEEDTSFKGDTLDDWRVYKTPYGIIERHYWARGGGLDRTGIDYKIITPNEIKEIANRAIVTAMAAQEAAEEFLRVTE